MGRVGSGQVHAALAFVGAYLVLGALVMATNLILFEMYDKNGSGSWLRYWGIWATTYAPVAMLAVVMVLVLPRWRLTPVAFLWRALVLILAAMEVSFVLDMRWGRSPARLVEASVSVTLLVWAWRSRAPNFRVDFGGRAPAMVAELPGPAALYEGEKVRRADLGNTHPWNRYFNHPLGYTARSIQEIAAFLRKCEYRHDRETRSHRDFWEPPDEFETRRRGDCEDHAIWAWRQLSDNGHRSRLVLGARHAWVYVFANDRCYLLEATLKRGRLWSLRRYQPEWSVERLEDRKFACYAHYRDV